MLLLIKPMMYLRFICENLPQTFGWGHEIRKMGHKLLCFDSSSSRSIDTLQLVPQMDYFGCHIIYPLIQLLKHAHGHLQEKVSINQETEKECEF